MKISMVGLLLLLLVSCGQEEPPTQASDGHDQAHEHGHSSPGDATSTARFGTPGDAAEADRTIEVSALDKLKFDPEELVADVGDTITFEVTNAGKLDHEFVLGDEDYQVAHEQAMSGGETMTHEGNGVFLEPGAESRITWTFTEPGIVFFACHVDGHSQAGMYGHIKVQ